MNIDIGFSYKDTGKIVCRLTIVAALLFSICTACAQTNAIRYSDYINNIKTAVIITYIIVVLCLD